MNPPFAIPKRFALWNLWRIPPAPESQGTPARILAKRGARGSSATGGSPGRSRPRVPAGEAWWNGRRRAACPAPSARNAAAAPRCACQVSIEAINKQLAEISQCAGVGAIALPILDGAGWPSSPQLIVPDNIVLLPLPPCAPELNSVENIWNYLRGNFLSHGVWDTCEAILDACCDAWNALIATPDVIASIGTREWAQVRI